MKREIIAVAIFAESNNSQEEVIGFFFDVKNKRTTSVESNKNGV